jgi:hypothetical protein
MPEPISPAIWAESDVNGQLYAMVRVPLNKQAPGASSLADARRELDRLARGVLETAFPEGWMEEGDRLAALYRDTGTSIQAAEDQIRALEAERNGLYTASGVTAERFDQIDDLQARAEGRKELAKKRLEVLREKLNEHSRVLLDALNASQARAKIVNGSAFEQDGTVAATLKKACATVAPVADQLLEQMAFHAAFNERKSTLSSLPSEIANEWLLSVTGRAAE